MSKKSLHEIVKGHPINTNMKNEIIAVKNLGDAIGYGHMMDLASALWRKMLRENGGTEDGAFVATIMDLLTDEGQEMALNNKEIYDELVK